MLDSMARAGRLGERGRTCVGEGAGTATEDARERTWILWLDKVGRDGVTEAHAAEASKLLAKPTGATRALDVAEVLVDSAPVVAMGAIEAALESAAEWHLPGLRAQSLQRLGRVWASADPDEGPTRWSQGLVALGVTGPEREAAMAACELAGGTTCGEAIPFGAAAPAPPVADDLVPCSNPGHLWMRGRTGRVFTTERDCMAFATGGFTDPDTRATAARLAALLALRHTERSEVTVLLRAVAPFLSGDAALAAEGWLAHTEFNDAVGAAWWTASMR
jgi:hypothetical protein